jgi:hypothetical protein
MSNLSRRADLSAELFYDMRVQSLQNRRNSIGKITSFRVCWTVSRALHRKSFPSWALADTFRYQLIAAAKRGEGFRTDRRALGLPALKAAGHLVTFAETYCAPSGSRHLRIIADALIDATEALITKDDRPDHERLRAANRWSFSSRISNPSTEPPKPI